jgi:hypothetical protein
MAPYIFRTMDYGKTWTRLVDDKKVKGYALCYLQDPVEPNLMFVGTEQGLWVSLDGGSTFQQFKNGYPSVSTYDLAIQEREADLAIASFGRSLYILDDLRPLRAAAANKGSLGSKPLTVMSSPVAYQAQMRSPSGIEYSTWGTYAADNRNTDASVNFFYRPQPDTGKAAKTDSATIKIYNNAGEAIRTYKAKVDTGFNRAYWGFQTKGIRMPQQPKPKPGAPEQGGGMQAEPGTYKVVVSAGKWSDSAQLEVKYDPRINYPADVRKVQKQFMDRLYKMTTDLTTANDALTDMDDGIKKMETLLKDEKGAQPDSIRKAGKAVQDSIKLIREYMFGKRQEKQGYGTGYQLTVQNKLNEVRQLVMGKSVLPGEQEERAVQIAQSLSSDAINRINALKNNQWKKYKELVSQYPMKILKD